MIWLILVCILLCLTGGWIWFGGHKYGRYIGWSAIVWLCIIVGYGILAIRR